MPYKKIACCIDFSENSNDAFNAAVELCEKFQSKLHLLHVMPPVVNPLLTEIEVEMTHESRTSLVLKIQDQMRMEYGEKMDDTVEKEFIVLDGHVSSEILNYLKEKEIDLAVLGSFGLSGMELVFFGSIAKRVAHKAPCSVMIVR